MDDELTLFPDSVGKKRGREAPLYERVRPRKLDEMLGITDVVESVRQRLKIQPPPSFIIWGPPGSGKTTLGLAIAREVSEFFFPFSASTSSIKEIKRAIEEGIEIRKKTGKYVTVFIDEIHRLNRSQQDVLLPFLEKREIVIIGATTENPSFVLRTALLSRMYLVVLKKPSREDMINIFRMVMEHPDGLKGTKLEDEALDVLLRFADGDLRAGINLLESAFLLSGKKYGESITKDEIIKAIPDKGIKYDRKGEEHYNLISAFIKSMRGGNPDAAIYYLARMLEGGEDPLYILRRMIIFAAEDIGNADPMALTIAVSAMHGFEKVGMPEGWIPIAQAVIYLATAPKSKASYEAYLNALEEIKRTGELEVPMHLRNAPTSLLEELGYGKVKDGYSGFLPEEISDRKFYHPSGEGYEKEIKKKLNGK